MPDVCDGVQLWLPGLEDCRSESRIPTPEEINEALEAKARLALIRRHRGCAPATMDYDWGNLLQEIKAGALKRLKRFQHGGKFTLHEFTYRACAYALCDIQRQNFKLSDSRLSPHARAELEEALKPKSYPLFDRPVSRKR